METEAADFFSSFLYHGHETEIVALNINVLVYLDSSSQPGEILSPKRHLKMPDNILGCHKGGMSFYWHPVSRGQTCC